MFEFSKVGVGLYDAIVTKAPAAVKKAAATTGLVVGSGIAATGAFATGVTIPDSGVDMPGYIAAAGVALGAIVVAAVGVYFGFWGIKEGLKWMRKV